MRYTRFSRKKVPRGLLPPPPPPAPTIRRGIGEFSPTVTFQLEKNLQSSFGSGWHAPFIRVKVRSGTNGLREVGKLREVRKLKEVGKLREVRKLTEVGKLRDVGKLREVIKL